MEGDSDEEPDKQNLLLHRVIEKANDIPTRADGQSNGVGIGEQVLGHSVLAGQQTNQHLASA